MSHAANQTAHAEETKDNKHASAMHAAATMSADSIPDSAPALSSDSKATASSVTSGDDVLVKVLEL